MLNTLAIASAQVGEKEGLEGRKEKREKVEWVRREYRGFKDDGKA